MPLLGDLSGLDDFWSDAPFVDAAEAAPPPAVAARAATQASAPKTGEATAEDTEAPAAPPVDVAAVSSSLEQLEALVHELRALRREHARQNRALMVLACLFVALLLSYLDRLRAGQRLTAAEAVPRAALRAASGW